MPWIHRTAVSVAARDRAGPLHPLLCRVVAELTEARPVRRIPEQLPCSFEPHRISAVLSLFQLGRDLVVDDCRGNGPLIRRAHGAIRMFPQVAVARLLPLVSVTTLSAAAPPIIRHLAHQPTLHTRARLPELWHTDPTNTASSTTRGHELRGMISWPLPM